MELYIKSEKPFVEEKVLARGGKEHIFVGIRVYNDNELEAIRKHFSDLADSVKLAKWQKELEMLQYDTNLSDDEIDETVAVLQGKIEDISTKQRDKLRAFYKEQVVYLKDASLTLKDGDKITDFKIKDSREATPLESLWDTPEECLAVLLDMYLGSPSYRDSLSTKITETILGTNFTSARIKN